MSPTRGPNQGPVYRSQDKHNLSRHQKKNSNDYLLIWLNKRVCEWHLTDNGDLNIRLPRGIIFLSGAVFMEYSLLLGIQFKSIQEQLLCSMWHWQCPFSKWNWVCSGLLDLISILFEIILNQSSNLINVLMEDENVNDSKLYGYTLTYKLLVKISLVFLNIFIYMYNQHSSLTTQFDKTVRLLITPLFAVRWTLATILKVFCLKSNKIA